MSSIQGRLRDGHERLSFHGALGLVVACRGVVPSPPDPFCGVARNGDLSRQYAAGPAQFWVIIDLTHKGVWSLEEIIALLD